uniref:Uncharacterized protein n=1 Tax=Sphaerodactylus townsendi TaxID=933632 RepID=A0ACB8EG21_9SAUR
MPLEEAVGSIFEAGRVPSENDQMQLSIDVKEEEEGDASLLEEGHLNEEATRQTLSERAESEELKENFWNPDEAGLPNIIFPRLAVTQSIQALRISGENLSTIV